MATGQDMTTGLATWCSVRTPTPLREGWAVSSLSPRLARALQAAFLACLVQATNVALKHASWTYSPRPLLLFVHSCLGVVVGMIQLCTYFDTVTR